MCETEYDYIKDFDPNIEHSGREYEVSYEDLRDSGEMGKAMEYLAKQIKTLIPPGTPYEIKATQKDWSSQIFKVAWHYYPGMPTEPCQSDGAFDAGMGAHFFGLCQIAMFVHLTPAS